MFIAGTNKGTVEVIAHTADPELCLQTNFWFDLNQCGKCGAGGNCDNPTPGNNCVDLEFSLGPSREGATTPFWR